MYLMHQYKRQDYFPLFIISRPRFKCAEKKKPINFLGKSIKLQNKNNFY